MFFLIAGVQPRTRTVDNTPRRCPNCGRSTAKLKRIDHYLSLFFIPLFPVKRGDEILICENCGYSSSPEGETFFVGPRERGGPAGPGGRGGMPNPGDGTKGGRQAGICSECGRAVEPRFSYCPYCGSRL